MNHLLTVMARCQFPPNLGHCPTTHSVLGVTCFPTPVPLPDEAIKSHKGENHSVQCGRKQGQSFHKLNTRYFDSVEV